MLTRLTILTLLYATTTGCVTNYVSDRCLHDVYLTASVDDTKETKRAIYKHNMSLKAVCEE